MSDIILSVKDITKHFRHIRALDGVSAEVREGSITAIVGDNGSGKSTLIKILSGTLRPDGGSMTVCGAEHPFLTVQRAMELGIRTVYQDLSLDNCKNSVENIFLGDELMHGPFLDRRAMRLEAERLLLLDEPTAAMGIHESHRTMGLLKELRDRGMTQLIISHNLHQVFDLADYIYVMRSGRIMAGAATQSTSPDELRSFILHREEEAL